MADLAGKTCVPCRGGLPPLKGKELQDLAKQVSGWKVVNEHHITKVFTFPDFKSALAFVNKVRRDSGIARPSPRYSAGLGQGGDHHLDAQDRRPHRKRFTVLAAKFDQL